MLVGAFQPTPVISPAAIEQERKRISAIPEDKRTQKDKFTLSLSKPAQMISPEFGFAPIWAFPARSLPEAYAHATLADPLYPLVFCLFDIPEIELIALDPVRHRHHDYDDISEIILDDNSGTAVEYVFSREICEYIEPIYIAEIYDATDEKAIIETLPVIKDQPQEVKDKISEQYHLINNALFQSLHVAYHNITEDIRHDPPPGLEMSTHDAKLFLSHNIMKDQFVFTVLPALYMALEAEKTNHIDTTLLAMTTRNIIDYARARKDYFEVMDDEKTPPPNIYERAYNNLTSLVCTNRQVLKHLLEHGKPRRNDPCPCGSGKKWKKCHGTSNYEPPEAYHEYLMIPRVTNNSLPPKSKTITKLPPKTPNNTNKGLLLPNRDPLRLRPSFRNTQNQIARL